MVILLEKLQKQKLIKSNLKDWEKNKTILNTNPGGNKKFYKLIVTFIVWETFIAFPRNHIVKLFQNGPFKLISTENPSLAWNKRV